jgi:hypothetical protein
MKLLPAQPSDSRTKQIFRTLLLCSGLLAIAPSAKAEVAQTPQWANQYQRAEWVSRVRIESVGSLINPSLSRNHLVAVQGYRYNASVVNDWKGGQKGDIRFQVDISDCHRLLTVDREYVVFGSINIRGGLQTYSCDDLISIEEAGSLLGFLDEYSRSSQQLVGQSGD